MTYQGLMFSIIIPNYNNAEWLDKCFTSIYEQRRKDHEVIFIDDMSTDNSLEIASKWCKKFDDMTVFKNSVKKWNGGSRNVALSFAKGKYLVFLDSDDTFADNTCLERIGNAIEDNNSPDLVRLSYATSVSGAEYPADLSDQDAIDKILASVSVACWTKCVKREKFVRFPENTLMEDVVQHIAQLDVIDSVAVCKGPIVKWNRDNANSCSRNPELQNNKWRSSLYRFYADLLDLEVKRPASQFELAKRRSMALDNIMNGRFEQ